LNQYLTTRRLGVAAPCRFPYGPAIHWWGVAKR
jgi:hypothetical protein